MSIPVLERSGWARLDISREAQSRVEAAFRAAGLPVEVIDLDDQAVEYHAWRHLGEYDGDYKTYAGDLRHCLLEMVLEHFLSVLLAMPQEVAR